MKINALKYEFRRMLGKTTRLDHRQPLPRNLMIGPLSYHQWGGILDGIFAACRQKSAIVLSYGIHTLDELLIFNTDKAIERGMVTEYSQVKSFDKLLPRIDRRWSPFIELLPMLNRKAAESLNLPMGKAWENLSKFTGLFLSLRSLEAQRRMREPISDCDIQYINELCQVLSVDFTLAS